MNDILDNIRAAGVVGAGGAGFPTHVKLEAGADTVLANGASCEPLLMSDPYLMETACPQVVRGLKTAMDLTGADRGIICLKGKHKKALAAVTEAVAADGDPRLRVFELEDFYPAGDEHVLVKEVLGRKVPEAGIPLRAGVVVSNIESLYNVAAAAGGRPVTHRFLTLAGEIARPMVVEVPVGSPVSEIIGFAGGPSRPGLKVVDGGPMMGRVLASVDAPVTKTTSGLLLLPEDHTVVAGKTRSPEWLLRTTRTVCCQCRRCTDLCPRYLLGHQLNPHKLMRALGDTARAEDLKKEALLCSECGVCEKFACPMMISPREVNALIKKELAAKGIRPEPSGEAPCDHPFRDLRRIATQRLMARLDVTRYDAHPPASPLPFKPSRVILRLDQHIGAPALPVVDKGAHVDQGDLVGEIPDNSLGARVHTGISGIVTRVAEQAVVIEQN